MVDCRTVFDNPESRSYTDRHGLKDLCKELLGIDISKQQQSSDWGSSTLSAEQLQYAAGDVLHLHAIKEKLDDMLAREGRQKLAQATFDFLPVRTELDLLAAGEDAIMARLREQLAARGLGTAMGASPADVVGFVRAAREGGAPPRDPMALQIPTTFAGQPLVTAELVEFAHRHDVQVHVWTINESDEMERLLDLGVDAVMSDFPGRLHEIVARRGARAGRG